MIHNEDDLPLIEQWKAAQEEVARITKKIANLKNLNDQEALATEYEKARDKEREIHAKLQNKSLDNPS